MSEPVQALTLPQVANWLRDAANLKVEGSNGAIVLHQPHGQRAITLRSGASGQAVSLTAHVAELPRDAHLAAFIQMQLLRLCADTHDLHGLRVALSADAQQVLLIDPALQIGDAQALIDRCELALEMAIALGEEIDRIVVDISTSDQQSEGRAPSSYALGETAHIFLP